LNGMMKSQGKLGIQIEDDIRRLWFGRIAINEEELHLCFYCYLHLT
jgi:hypothetical protein